MKVLTASESNASRPLQAVLAFSCAAAILGLAAYAVFALLPTTEPIVARPGLALRVHSPFVPAFSFAVGTLAVALLLRRPIVEARGAGVLYMGIAATVLSGVAIVWLWGALNMGLYGLGPVEGNFVLAVVEYFALLPLFVIWVTVLTWFMPFVIGTVGVLALRWIDRTTTTSLSFAGRRH